MGAAHLHRAAGFGHVDGLRLQSGFPLHLLQHVLPLVHAFGQPLARLVDLRAHLGPFLRSQLAHALEQLGQGALLAQHLDAQRVQRGGVLHFGEVLFHLLPQFPQSICHCHDEVPPSIVSSKWNGEVHAFPSRSGMSDSPYTGTPRSRSSWANTPSPSVKAPEKLPS